MTYVSEDYIKAYKMGKKDYQARMMRGEVPTLKVLDDILPSEEVPIPKFRLDLSRYRSTRSLEQRPVAEAARFPEISCRSSEKIRNLPTNGVYLIDSHLKEGIHDPVKAYEYMNKFYIEEGNKRVSVLKYCDAVSVPGNVTRILPARTDQKENKIYYEFVDFYALSQINYIYFSKLGSFAKLQEAVGKGPKELWTDDDKLNFSSVYSRFAAEYEAAGGKKLSIYDRGMHSWHF